MDGLGFLGLIDKMFSSAYNYQMYEENKQFSIDMANQSHQWDIETMEKAHEMNSPAEKKRQLSEAGLHPSMMLQGDSFANVSQPSAPMAAVPQPPTIDGVLSSMIQAEQLKSLQIQNDFAPTLNAKNLDLLDKQLESLGIKNKLDSQQWEILDASKQFTVAKNAADLDEALERIKLLQEQVKKTEQETSNLKTQGGILDKELDFETFKKEFRDATGVAYSDDHLVQAYSLLREGKLGDVFETLVTAAKSALKSVAGEVRDSSSATRLISAGSPLLQAFQLLIDMGVF